jgi:hypothetical protein
MHGVRRGASGVLPIGKPPSIHGANVQNPAAHTRRLGAAASPQPHFTSKARIVYRNNNNRERVAGRHPACAAPHQGARAYVAVQSYFPAPPTAPRRAALRRATTPDAFTHVSSYMTLAAAQ